MKSILFLATTVLATSLAFAQDPSIIVGKVQGNVIYTDASGSESVVEGKILPAKGSLAATGQASAELNFGNGCVITLQSGQRIDLSAATTCDGWKAAVVNIPGGALGSAGAVAGGGMGGIGLGTTVLALAGVAGAVKLIQRNRQNSSPN